MLVVVPHELLVDVCWQTPLQPHESVVQELLSSQLPQGVQQGEFPHLPHVPESALEHVPPQPSDCPHLFGEDGHDGVQQVSVNEPDPPFVHVAPSQLSSYVQTL